MNCRINTDNIVKIKLLMQKMWMAKSSSVVQCFRWSARSWSRMIWSMIWSDLIQGPGSDQDQIISETSGSGSDHVLDHFFMWSKMIQKFAIFRWKMVIFDSNFGIFWQKLWNFRPIIQRKIVFFFKKNEKHWCTSLKEETQTCKFFSGDYWDCHHSSRQRKFVKKISLSKKLTFS